MAVFSKHFTPTDDMHGERIVKTVDMDEAIQPNQTEDMNRGLQRIICYL